jgi:RHS repeat-associated protein
MASSYQRVDALNNRFKVQGKEYQNDFELGLYDFEWRQYDPAIARTLTKDPHSENYVDMSPYSWVINNPIIVIDPDGRDINITFDSDDAKEAYLKILNKGLEGQFTATLTEVKGKEGVYSVGIKAAKGGNYDNLTEQGQAFYTSMSGVINDHENTVNLTGVYGDEDVQVGQYTTGKIDLADIEQYNTTGPEIEKSVGATQIGKLTHETVEQYQKTIYGVQNGSLDGFGAAHSFAIQSENSINQNKRGKQYGSFKDYTIPYTDSNGKVVHVRTQTRDAFGGKRKVVKVTQPKPLGKKRDK